MTIVQEYPLVENLEAIKRDSNKNSDEKIQSILSVLKEEVNSLNKDEKIHLRWDVALSVFNNVDVNKAIRLEQLRITVQDCLSDCIAMNHPVMYHQTAMFFYGLYSKEVCNGLSNEDNNNVIISVFTDKIKELDEGFKAFLVPHIFKMLNFKRTSMNKEEQEQWAKSLINKYRKDYDGSLFIQHVEEAISEFETKNN